MGQTISQPIEIKLANKNPFREYSAMTWKSDTLFIFAQRDTTSFFFTLNSEIETALNSGKKLKLDSVPVYGLNHFARNLDSHGKKVYDGIEACVIIGDTIFISIEGTGDYCFILKGLYTGNAFEFDPINYLTLPKPYKTANYGFENLVLLDSNYLMAVFETAADGLHHKIYTFNINLKDTSSVLIAYCDSYRKIDGRELRLADICKFGYLFLGIDFRFRYKPKDKNEKTKTQLVTLNIKKDSVIVKPLDSLGYMPNSSSAKKRNSINFEGITAFKDGILLISDDCPSDYNRTYFYYYKLDFNFLKN